jgi:transcription antitermination factor NusG
MYQTERRRGNRAKAADVPLFPGYVFCQFDMLKRLPVLVTPGVVAVVSRGRVPVPIDASEIASIKALVSSGAKMEPCPYLEVGQRVRVAGTALQGVEGILTAFKGGRRIVVSVSLLQRAIALEIDRALVTQALEAPADAGTVPALNEIAV